MILIILIPVLLIISFLWAYYSLQKALKKQKDREELLERKKSRDDFKHNEEVVLFELKD